MTDEGRFLPLFERRGVRRLTLHLAKGTPVSVFATDPATSMNSKGLEWPLKGVRFENLYCATLNRASEERIEIASDRPAFVFIGGGNFRTRGK